MDKALQTHLTDIIREHEAQILSSWLEHQRAVGALGSGLVKEAEVREQSHEFLGMLKMAMYNGNLDLMAPQWAELRDMLTNFSATRAQQGFTPSQTAMFIFSRANLQDFMEHCDYWFLVPLKRHEAAPFPFRR